MAIHLEMNAEFAHGTEKFLCLTGGFESLHSTLSHTRHLMRVFRLFAHLSVMRGVKEKCCLREVDNLPVCQL